MGTVIRVLTARVRILDEVTVNKIAAGEVVERPASVVKELVENAIDAGARHISIDLSDGGLARISVTDDGCGMSSEDARLALERHATSKITSSDDLFSIATLGFRGEALPSIASVSKLKLVTRETGNIAGTSISICGGVTEAVGECGCPEGTTVTVTNLFFNVPARKKFLKGPAVELDRCATVITALALSRPDIAFVATNNDREILRTPGSGRLDEALLYIFGKEFTEQLLPVDGEQGGVRVQGFVGRPGVSRAARTHQFFSVNGRPVAGFPLQRAVDEAFAGLLPIRRFAIAILLVEYDPAAMDVNVHPAKLQIRFYNEGRVLGALREIIKAAITAARPSWSISPGPSPFSKEVAAFAPAVADGGVAYHVPAFSGKLPVPEKLPFAQARESGDRLPWLRVLGQVADTYILAEGAGGLYIIDQHAAHERINYESLRRMLLEGHSISQPLLVPESVRLRSEEKQTWVSNRPLCERIGFVAEDFGGDTVLLREVPMSAVGYDHANAFIDLITSLRDSAYRSTLSDADSLTRAAMAACKASIKAGDPLSVIEMERLLADLARLDNPFTCPHGRPVAVQFTLPELQKLFWRT